MPEKSVIFTSNLKIEYYRLKLFTKNHTFLEKAFWYSGKKKYTPLPFPILSNMYIVKFSYGLNDDYGRAQHIKEHVKKNLKDWR